MLHFDDFRAIPGFILYFANQKLTLNFLFFKRWWKTYLIAKLKSSKVMEVGSLIILLFFNIFVTNDIIFQKSCPHTQAQNGVIECKHRHLIELARIVLIHSNFPTEFWVDAPYTATYTINRLPSSVLGGVSPFEKLFHPSPSYSFLKRLVVCCFPC